MKTSNKREGLAISAVGHVFGKTKIHGMTNPSSRVAEGNCLGTLRFVRERYRVETSDGPRCEKWSDLLTNLFLLVLGSVARRGGEI